MKRIYLPLLLFSLINGACNLPFDLLQQSTPTPPVIASATASPQIVETMATASSTPVPATAPTDTPDQAPPSLLSSGGDLICRFGPGLRYGIGGYLKAGQSVLITARDGPGEWFQVELPGYSGKYCWLASYEVEASGDLSVLGIAEAPPSFVTQVTVMLDPPVYKPVVCVFPLTFEVSFTIETIGPARVRFERSASIGGSAPVEQVEFSAAGPKSFDDTLQVNAPGEYWFRVSVSDPNSVVGQAVGQVICP